MLIMVGSIVLGMGLPSAVCYLLMATLIGPIIGGLGVVPLAAHFFIFYFGMMSMVTPPVALAAYAAASIANCDIMRTALAAFRFALVGFTLPFMFVFRTRAPFPQRRRLERRVVHRAIGGCDRHPRHHSARRRNRGLFARPADTGIARRGSRRSRFAVLSGWKRFQRRERCRARDSRRRPRPTASSKVFFLTEQ